MKKGSKSSKKGKKQPFAKRQSSAALGLIVGLTIFNLVYSYAIGVPLTRTVVASYVESVYALGDAQERGYEVMGAAVVALATQVGNIPARFTMAASPNVAAEVVSQPEPVQVPLLLVAPNQISIAK